MLGGAGFWRVLAVEALEARSWDLEVFFVHIGLRGEEDCAGVPGCFRLWGVMGWQVSKQGAAISSAVGGVG